MYYCKKKKTKKVKRTQKAQTGKPTESKIQKRHAKFDTRTVKIDE